MGYFNIYGQYVQDDSELYHHGILGMRWGKKNGPPYPLRAGDHSASEKKAGWRKSLDGPSKSEARKYTRALNKEDQRQVELISKNQKMHKKAFKDLDKYDKIVNKYGKDSDKAKKFISKFENKYKSVTALEQAIRDSEARTWTTLLELSNAGYDISSKKIMRDAARGKRIAVAALGGLAGNIIYSSTAGKGTIIEGNKFKVTVNAEGKKGSITFDNRDLTQKPKKSKESNQTKEVDSSKPSTENSNPEGLSPRLQKKAEKLSHDIRYNAKVRNKVLENNADLRKAYYDTDDAIEVDLKAWEKKHKKEFDGDGGEFYEKMLKDPNSNTYKAKKKWNDMVNEYSKKRYSNTDQGRKPLFGSGSKKAVETSNNALRVDKMNTETGKKLTKAFDEADSRATDSREISYMKYGHADSSEVKKAKANAEKARNNLRNYINSDASTDDVMRGSSKLRDSARADARRMSSQMSSRASSMRSSGMSYSEIAERLGVSESAVWSIINDKG